MAGGSLGSRRPSSWGASLFEADLLGSAWICLDLLGSAAAEGEREIGPLFAHTVIGARRSVVYVYVYVWHCELELL